MALIADSKDYSRDRRAASFAIILCFGIPLMLVPLYLFVSPVEYLPRPAAAALLAGSLLFMLFAGLYLKGRGILFKFPMRVLDNGILIQPMMRLRPVMADFRSISSIELWHGRDGDPPSGCSVLSGDKGRLISAESFCDAESLCRFAESISPALYSQGFRKTEMREPGSYSAVFRKVLPRVPSPG